MPDREQSYAGFWRRSLAAALDNVTWLIAAGWLLASFPESVYDDHPEVIIVVSFVLASLWFNYFAFCEWRWGQTIGKNATGIEVRSVDGAERLNFAQASIRNLLRLIDFFVIGELMIATGRRKQRLGDKAAKTVVVRRAPRIKRVAAGAAPSRNVPIRGAADPNGPGEERPRPKPPPPAPQYASSPPPQAPAQGGFPPPPQAPSLAQPGTQKSRLPDAAWGVSGSIWGLIGGLLLVVIVPPLLVLPFEPDLADPDKASDAAILATQGIFDALLVTVAIGIATSWKFNLREAAQRLGLRRFRPSALGWMFAMLGTYYVGAAIFSTLVIQPEQEDIGKELGVCNPGIGIALAAVLLIAVVAPLTEELFFRGFFFAGLRSRWSLWPSALLSGVVFGLVHAPTGPTAAIPLAGLGVGLAWLYNRTGSLWPGVIAHLLNNSLAITVVLTQC